MRNLKRALSLGLTAAMISGLMVMGSSAASYADVTSEQNQEAIEVLQAVGVMVGDEDGNFNPDAQVTRNEMAVVMSNLMEYNVATYSGTSPFTDVPSWAEPYVAACWTNGITAGYSATTYGGSDTVTTAQAALMLMKALGYFQYASDFGSDWQLETVSQATKIDLFTDVDSGVREAMTRNDLAQLVLNTLKAGTVEADDDTIHVSTGDVVVEAGKVQYNFITSGEAYAGAIKGLTVAGTVVNSGTRIVELGEKLYQGNLKMYENQHDDFGRPGTRWTYKTTAVGTFSDDPVAVYTGKMSKDNLYDVLGKDVVDNYDIMTYVDGVGTYSATITTAYAQANSSSASCGSGKGVLTEVYVDSDAERVTVTATNTYLMQATGDYSESKGTVAVTTLTTPVGGLTNSVNSLSSDDFDNLSGLAEDDYILYTYAQGKVQSAVKAEVVTGEVTAYSTATKTYGDAAGSVTIAGTKYDYAKYAEEDGNNGCATEFSVGNSAAIVVDAYGYALYVDDAALSMGNYVYIDAVALETNLSTKVIADAYFYDGTNQTITLKPGTTLTGLVGVGTTRANVGDWYSYSRNSSDEYTLTIADTSGDGTAVNDVINNNKVTLFTGANAVQGNGAVAGNSNTVFIVKDEDDAITVYTGIVNVPDITIDTAHGGKIVYMRDKDNATKAASLVYVDVGDNGSVKSTTTSLLYTVKKDTTYVDNSDNEKVERWYVVMDGKLTTVETKETWAAKNIYEDYSQDADGYYETGSAYDVPDDADKDTVTLNGKITQSGDTLTLAGTSAEGYGTSYVVNSDTQITLIMIPDNKGDGYPLSGEVMDDNNADYQVVEGIAARTLANTFKDRNVAGTAYAIYDDQGKSDLLSKVYVVVTACSAVDGTTVTPPDPESGSIATTVVADLSTAGQVTFKIAGPTYKTADKIAALKEAAAEELGCTAADITVTQNGTNWTVASDYGNMTLAEQPVVQVSITTADQDEHLAYTSNWKDDPTYGVWYELVKSGYITFDTKVTATGNNAITISGKVKSFSVNEKVPGFGGDLNPAQTIAKTYCTGGTNVHQTDLTDSTRFAIIAVYDAAGAGQYWLVGNGTNAYGNGGTTGSSTLNGTTYTITWDLEW